MMLKDPWDAFGSDSGEEETSELPPPARATAPHTPRRPIMKKRRPWESLLPSFAGAPDLTEAARRPASSRPASSSSSTLKASREMLSSAAGVAGEGAGDDKGVRCPGPRAPFSKPPLYQHPAMLYDARMPHRGGGRGFVAGADIAPGTLLLAEKRFLPMPTAMDCGRAGGVGQEELCLKWILALPPTKLKKVLGEMRLLHPQSLEDLPPDEARMLMTIHTETAEAMITELGPEASRKADLDARAIVRLLGALQSNGFSSGIYLHSAMTNHSCRPNAIKWQAGRSISASCRNRGQGLQETTTRIETTGGDDEAKTSEIRATEFIRKGEEITVSYLEPREISLATRQSRLKEQFGFECDCRLCRDGYPGDSPTPSALEAFVAEDEKALSTVKMEMSEFPGCRNGCIEADTVVLDGDRRPRRKEQIIEENAEETVGKAAHADAMPRGEEVEGVSASNIDDGNGGSNEARADEDDDFATRGLVAVNLLERRLEATESVLDLLRPSEVRWPGVLSELLGYRRQASSLLACRHIALARADKIIAKACAAILQGPIETAQSDTDCVESVKQASDELPPSFGGERAVGVSGNLEGSFKIRLLAVFLAALVSRRKTQLLYLGDAPHPEAGVCLSDLSQATGMLLAQGSESEKWIRRLPGDKPSRSLEDPHESGHGQSEKWWDDGIAGASSFEQSCQKAAERIGRLYEERFTG